VSKKLSAYQFIVIGYACTGFGSLLMLVLFIFGWFDLFTFLAPLFFIMMGLPMVYSSVTVMALSEHNDKATGSAVMSCITMAVALIATFVLTMMPDGNPLTMPFLFVGVMILAILVTWHAKLKYKN
jgi:hypothetical protein